VNPSRRQFLRTSALAGASAALAPNALSATLARTLTAASMSVPAALASHRLSAGWEYHQGPLTAGDAWKPDDSWKSVTLPHCFNAYDACDPDTPYYRGQGWYRTHIKINNPYPNGRTLLHFEGAGQTSTLYVGNDIAGKYTGGGEELPRDGGIMGGNFTDFAGYMRVGKHIGGYDEFLLDITTAANETAIAAVNATPDASKLPVIVVCDNSHDDNRMPSDLSDFTLYGGLYRHVNLVYVPAVSVAKAHIDYTLPADKSDNTTAKVSVTAALYNPTALTAPLEVTVSISRLNGKLIATKKQTIAPWQGEIELTNITIPNPDLWSPDSPALYDCTVNIVSPAGVSTLHERFGVRRTELVEHGPFLLNGERLLLRGTQRHQDQAGTAGAEADSLVRQELQLVKEMGANFIRLAHYQQSPLVLALCDELGLLVWEELCWCRSGVVSEEFKQQGREKLTTMIDQHRNHPCVLFWGLGNEDDWPDEAGGVKQDAIRAYMAELNDLAHKLDPTRYTSFRRCAFASDIPDAYSPSIWAGWYSGSYTEYKDTLDKARPTVNHLIHIEWGADSHARRHSENPDKVLAGIALGHGTDERGLAFMNIGGDARVSRDGDWSETYACNLFDWHLKTQETLPWFTGSAQWIIKDFTTPVRPDNPIPRMNQKGLLERDMTKKEGYFVFQSFWSRKPMAHIYGHSWPVRWGDAGEPKMVKVYSNCDTAELFLNGKSLGVKKRDSQNFPAAGLRWTTPFLSGKNHLRVVATQGAATVPVVTVTDEIDFLYQTEKWGAPAAFALKVLGERGTGEIHGAMQSAVTVEATLLDANGKLCLDARTRVRFACSGGTLHDNLGTVTGSRVVELCNGRAWITLSHPISVGSNPAYTLSVSADKLPTATIHV